MGTNRVGGIFIVICCAMLAACHAAPSAAKRSSRPDPTPVIAAHTTKDAAITDSAARIDVIAEPTDLAAIVHAETDRIRQALKDAPASDIATLATRYADTLDARDHALARLETKLNKEEAKARAAYKRWLYTSGGGLLLSFAITLVFGRAGAAARTWPLAALGLGAFVLAEVISSQWFQIGCLVLIAGAVAYLTYWLIDRHKQGRLQQALEKRAALLREIVPVLDEAYENASDDVKRLLDRNLFNRFSDRFDDAAKAEIHQLRKEAAHA